MSRIDRNWQVRGIGVEDREWVRAFFREHWGSTEMVYSKGIHHCDELPGFAAMADGQVLGLLTYAVQDGACEVVSVDSVAEGRGVGSALLRAMEAEAAAQGLERVWLITTNDNVHALGWYQKRGYELVAVYRHAVDQARRLKPQIPLVANNGIPIRDEIELEKWLRR